MQVLSLKKAEIRKILCDMIFRVGNLLSSGSCRKDLKGSFVVDDWELPNDTVCWGE